MRLTSHGERCRDACRDDREMERWRRKWSQVVRSGVFSPLPRVCVFSERVKEREREPRHAFATVAVLERAAAADYSWASMEPRTVEPRTVAPCHRGATQLSVSAACCGEQGTTAFFHLRKVQTCWAVSSPGY